MRIRIPSRSRLLALLVLAGCDSLVPVESHEPITDPTKLFVALRLNHPAVTMSTEAPYNRLQLTATPYDATGSPMDGLSAPTFRSSDTLAVWVSPDGLLEARAPATGVLIVAELAGEGNVSKSDTAVVNVIAGPPPAIPARLTIAPEPPDSAVWSMATNSAAAGLGGFLLEFIGIAVQPALHPRILDESGAPIAGLPIAFESLAPEIAWVEGRTGYVYAPRAPGNVPIVARSTAYGVALADTVVFKVTLPAIHGVSIVGDSATPPRFEEPHITIRQNGIVFWVNQRPDTVDVIFEDTTHVEAVSELCAFFAGHYCDAGDIPLIDGTIDDVWAQIHARRFPVPGVYTYRSERLGRTGRVVVVADEVPASEPFAPSVHTSYPCLSPEPTSCR